MNWKFWHKEKQPEPSSGTNTIKLAKPKDLPQQLGMYLVTQLKMDPDWVWNLKCVLRPLADQKNGFDFRVFNPETRAARSITVVNFNSLDAHPELILLSGKLNNRTGQVQLDEKLQKVA